MAVPTPHISAKLWDFAKTVLMPGDPLRAEYIAKNYDTRITLEQLANLIDTDKYRLCHLFKKYTGGTVVEYINFVRLRRAEQLLADSDMNATEVASACGFASIQYFDKVFRKAVGCSPSVYRKNAVLE